MLVKRIVLGRQGFGDSIKVLSDRCVLLSKPEELLAVKVCHFLQTLLVRTLCLQHSVRVMQGRMVLYGCVCQGCLLHNTVLENCVCLCEGHVVSRNYMPKSTDRLHALIYDTPEILFQMGISVYELGVYVHQG